MAKVAVITRTKGRPLFMARVLESVGSQTYKDYEHVIVNDSGKELRIENYLDSLDDSAKSRVRVINRHQASNAPDTIFTESVDATKSDYVVIHDDDDTWHEDFLSLAVERLDANAEVGGVVVRTDKVIEEVNGNGNIRQLKKKQYMPDVKAISLYQQCIENQLTPIAFIYRRKAYEDVGKYDSSLPVCGDWEFGIRFLMGYDVDFIDPGFALANYHHRKVPKLGVGDNSFVAHSHRYYSNKIRNNYLRQELKEGRLGIGYIMSKLTYSQSYTASIIKKMLPSSLVKRLKGIVRG